MLSKQFDLLVNDKPLIGFFSATAIVIANIIGTGIFTTSGFLAEDLNSSFAVLIIWLIGGILAFCGALSYSQLVSVMPKSGGEYYYLLKIYGPALGFLSAWVSLFAGFSAPIAASSVAFGKYLSTVFTSISSTYSAIVLIIILSLLHSFNLKLGYYTQNFFTVLKVVVITTFIIFGFLIGSDKTSNIVPSVEDLNILYSPSFAVSLIFVSFAYSGWNASTYITSEVKNPAQNVPKSLLLGTLIVSVLYILLNYIFLKNLGLENMKGKIEIGYYTALEIFGNSGANIISIIISVILISSASAMIVAGSRVIGVVGENILFFRIISKKSLTGAPIYAIFVQSIIALVLVVTATFESILYYIGFSINIFSFLAVLGVFVMRFKNPDVVENNKTWGHPFAPLLYLTFTLWIITFTAIKQPIEFLVSMGTLLLGLIVFLIVKD